MPEPTAASESAPSAESNITQVELAKKELAKRTGVDVSAITVTSVAPVEWNDSSLGCPDPATSYMQVITPGYQIALEADGKTYDYHTDTKDRVVLCENKTVKMK